MRRNTLTFVSLACALVIALTGPARARADPIAPVPAVNADSAAVRFRTLMEAWCYAEAESVAVEALAAAKAEQGAASPAVAHALEWRAKARAPRGGERDSAISWVRRALEIREAGDDTLALVGSLTLLGLLLNRDGAFPGQEYLERAVALCEQARGPNALECSGAILSLGRCGGWDSGLPRVKRRPLVERALRIREGWLGPNHPDVAECLIALAGLASATDTSEVESTYSLDDSLPLLQRARAILEAARGYDHPDVARVLEREDRAHWLRQEYAESESCFTRALAIYERSVGPVSGAVGALVNNHGMHLWTVGDCDKALPLLRRYVQICEELEARWMSRVVGFENLGAVLEDMGEYAEALQWFERSAELSEAHFGLRPRWYTTRLSALESCLWVMGDYERAVVLNRRVVKLADSLGVLWSDPFFVNELVLSGLANGDTALTRVALDSMFVLYRRRPIDPQDLSTQTVFAGTYVLLNQQDRAVAEYERLDEDFGGSPVPGSAWHGELLRDLAAADRIAGNLVAADSTARQALAMLERRLGSRNPEVVRTRLVLAGIRRQRGDSTGAFALAAEAETVRREYVRVVSRALPEAQALHFAATQPTGLGLLLTTAATSGDQEQVRTAWDALVHARGLVQDEMSGRWREVLEGNLCTSAYSEASRRYARLLVSGSSGQTGEYYVQELERARQTSERAERELAQSCAVFGEELARGRVGLQDVLGALPAGDALVAYARVPAEEVLAGGLVFEPIVRGRSAGASAVYVALVQSAAGDDPRAVLLGRAGRIDSLVAQWRRVVGAPVAASATAEPRYRGMAQTLRAAIWDPLREELRGAERVFVVPDGALSLVSVATLPAEAGGYLVEQGPTIHYLSAERDLALPPGSRAEGEGLLAVGDPDVDGLVLGSGANMRGVLRPMVKTSSDECASLRGTHWSRLPGARREVAEVATHWSADEPRRILLGVEATEAEVKAALPGRRVLHLATHGFATPAECPRGTSEERGSLLRGALRVVDPFGLSGLVLAGGNRRATATRSDEDGVLLAQEIARLDLAGTEWAVLSGCETGVGEVLPGEGVYGLRRAFEVAGARTVVMSLWAVEDEATRAWMGHLYRARFEEKKDTAESVRSASLAVLAERRTKGESTHPFYWGAFVAAGDWR